MKIVKKLKRDTIIIVLSVFILTLLTIRVSYAAFFVVKSQSTVQKYETKELEVLISKDGATASSKISLREIFPTLRSELPTAADTLITQDEGSFSKITLTNSGSYDAEYVVSIGYDDALPEGKTTKDLISLKYLNIGILNKTTNNWVNFGDAENGRYYIPITNLEESEPNVYPVLNGTIDKGASQNYDFYIWLDEDTPVEEIEKLVYLKLTIDSTTLNDGEDAVVKGD